MTCRVSSINLAATQSSSPGWIDSSTSLRQAAQRLTDSTRKAMNRTSSPRIYTFMRGGLIAPRSRFVIFWRRNIKKGAMVCPAMMMPERCLRGMSGMLWDSIRTPDNLFTTSAVPFSDAPRSESVLIRYSSLRLVKLRRRTSIFRARLSTGDHSIAHGSVRRRSDAAENSSCR